MAYYRQVTASKLTHTVVLPILFFSLFACRFTRGYQRDKPFVYKTKIKVDQKMPNDEKQDLIARLENQLDDSLRAKTVTAPRFLPPFLWKKLQSPPVFDTLNLSRSIVYMNSLLNSIGYYAPVITDSIETGFKKNKSHGDQHRVCITFNVKPGKRLIFDSVGFDLQTPALQALTMKSKDQSLLKKNQPYSKQILGTELNRIVDTFRSNGYYKFSREDLYVEHDTVFAALIDPTMDPLQQAELLQKLERRRQNPTINVVIKQRPIKDSSHLMQYYIGNVTVYPDLPTTEDTSIVHTDTTKIRNVNFITRSNKFKLPFIANNIYLRQGRLYKQDNYYRTSNRFTQFTAWQYFNIDFENSTLGDSLLDMTMRMYPAKKLKLTSDLEASRNTNDIVTASNLFGVGVNFGVQDRNAFKQSVLTSTNLRGGVEFGADFIQTGLASVSHTIAFPRLIFLPALERKFRSPQTLLSFNASYTDRRHFYTVRSINGSFGWQGSRSRQTFTSNNVPINKNKVFLFRPLNIEYNNVDESDSLKNMIRQNPSLILAFKTGLVIGTQFVYTTLRQKGNKTNAFRFGFEESGALLGFIKKLEEGDLLRFVKGDVDFTHTIGYGKTQLAFHGFAGAGIAYGKSGSGIEQTLPIYKAYFSGGPNTMRAWQVRRLGLGSTKFYNDTPRTNLDRFGDIKLEANIEYRFLLGTVFGVKLNSALFTDIGNVWSRKPIDPSAAAQGSDFQINRFYKEFAVGMGTGLRLDFSYFLIRLDWAYKVRDPQREEGADKWFYDMRLANGQFQLGIGYPF
ncbi:MAG: BamA/TamA family outer membrane protein [Bacteroidetes bacterium]|nr:BamA/TamA family outer membrane protein [Bacteroidota bacterium]